MKLRDKLGSKRYRSLMLLVALVIASAAMPNAARAAEGEKYEQFKSKWLGKFRAESYYSAAEVEQHRANRGMVNLYNVFVPKGQWVVGATGSYSNHINTDFSLAIVNSINSDGYSVKASPFFGYTVADNMVAGARFEYGRSLLRIDEAKLSVAGTELGLVDLYSITQSYNFAAIFRQYIPIGNSQRFSLFTEVRLDAGFNRSKMAYDSPVVGTYAKGHNMGLNIIPGVVAFATNNVAFEVTVGFMGVGYSYTQKVKNQVYFGEVDTSNLSLSLNLLSVGLGVAFYL